MPIKYGALLPHCPLLIPAIGKDNISLLNPTIEAYDHVISKLKEKEISTILIISPHGDKDKNKVSINESLSYDVKFAEFGDLSTKISVEPNLKLSQKIKDNQQLEEFFSFSDKSLLDYGAGIPIYLLASKLNNLNFLTFNSSLENLEYHFKLGKSLSPTIKKYEKNVAVIASGDMSHCLSKNSPGGYSSKGAKFDSQIKEILNKNENIEKNILNINDNLIKKANECGLKTLMLALGLMDNYSYQTKVLSYQDNLGIGYLSASFENLQEK